MALASGDGRKKISAERFLKVELFDEEEKSLGVVWTRTVIEPDLLLDDFGSMMHGLLPSWAKFHHLPVCERNDLKKLGVEDPRPIRTVKKKCFGKCVMFEDVCVICGVEGEV